MVGTYTLKIVTDFASAHTLRDYPGDCSRMHGHNWKVEVEVIASDLDQVGMGVDFKVIKQATKEVASRLDHRLSRQHDTTGFWTPNLPVGRARDRRVSQPKVDYP